jgi:hypothetical protein
MSPAIAIRVFAAGYPGRLSINRVTRAHRIFFTLVGSFALWVGVWGYFVPSEIGRAIPWQVPTLHARFIGAMYLSGMVLMGLALVARRLAEVQIAVVMAAVWTGMLLLVSLFHLGEFDYSRLPVWFWFGAYVAYPLMGAGLARLQRPTELPKTLAAVPGWARMFLAAQGTVCLALAAGLFFGPARMASLWPWPIPTLLAQIYSGPFLSYGVGSLLLAQQRYWIELRIALASMAVFAALVLLASLMHRGLFAPIGVSASIWFGGFAVATAVLAFLSFCSMLPDGVR